MKKIGYTALIIGFFKLVGSGGSDSGILAGIFMLLLGAFLIYRGNKKEVANADNKTDDFEDDSF